ncbi:MAG: hypothetical protein H7246_04820 [Phycisphaerae bacterium]|nr:hypothetical protein [Saprospiraceae bacterium]
MNLVLFLLSFFFASQNSTAHAPCHHNDAGTIKKSDHGKDKGGKFKDGDYIIWNDTNP